MSVSLSNAFVTLFDAEVKQAYQAKAMLVGAVRQRRGVEGSTVKFPKVGKGVATARITQTDVTPMNVGFSSVTCTLQDWNAAEYSDIFSQQKVNFDERQELVQVVASAMGRRQDQLILDALGSSGTSLTVANSIGQLGTNNTISYSSPVQVGTKSWVQISGINGDKVFAIDDVGQLYAWGNNTFTDGVLGLGDTISRSNPTLVPNPVGTSWTRVMNVMFVRPLTGPLIVIVDYVIVQRSIYRSTQTFH